MYCKKKPPTYKDCVEFTQENGINQIKKEYWPDLLLLQKKETARYIHWKLVELWMLNLLSLTYIYTSPKVKQHPIIFK